MLGELHIEGPVSRLRLHGDLDLVTVNALRDLLARACSEGRDVVVDLADVPFVDVLSLSAILAAADGLRDHGRRLLVTGASAPVRRVCALLNADDVLMPELPLPRFAVR